MKKVTVLIGNCVSADPRHTFSAINWANKNNFELLCILPGFIPSKMATPGGAMAGTAINQVYATTTKENFQKVTGKEYSLDEALKVQLVMADDQEGKLAKV